MLRVCDASAVHAELPEAYAVHFFENTPGLQEAVFGDLPRIGGSLKRRNADTSIDDAGVKDESATSQALRLDVKESRTTGPTNACKGTSHARTRHVISKIKEIGMKKHADQGEQLRDSVNDVLVADVFQKDFFGVRQRDVENGGCRSTPDISKRKLTCTAPDAIQPC
ncbi:hypothetical protein HPB51_023577 [Rhipicephalus microplus]|uniref:Uncharacterized protein n=1 Tax=Rhipicephalus microplus TaxID=6941 RepID=A0A9J6DCV4_RHIMP|nr:hypothetical protein HPB51_023577 [Rhipicephalus microplus]